MSPEAASIDTRAAEQPVARIGPNALIQTVASLGEHFATSCIEEILNAAGQRDLLTEQPESMVPERRFIDLVSALSGKLGVGRAREVLHRSGQLTADYLLAHRIPAPFQAVLRVMPRRLALWMLLYAIRNHAWTFTGSGEFAYRDVLGSHPQLMVTTEIRPAYAVCGFYGGTFEHLIHELIDSGATMRLDVQTSGSEACCVYTFEYS